MKTSMNWIATSIFVAGVSSAACLVDVVDDAYDEIGEVDSVESAISRIDWIGTPTLINTLASGTHGVHDSARLKNGDVVHTWSTWEGSTMYDVFVAIQKPDGTVTKKKVNATSGNQLFSSVAALPEGQFVVTYTSETCPNGPGRCVLADYYGMDGTYYSTIRVSRSDDPSDPAYTAVAANEKGFAVAWAGRTVQGWRVYMRAYSLDASQYSRVSSSLSHTPHTIRDTAITILTHSNGNQMFAVSYAVDDGSSDVLFQRFIAGSNLFGDWNGNGSTLTASAVTIDVVPGSTAHKLSPTIAGNGTYFVVIWLQQHVDGVDYNVMGRVFNLNGTPRGSEFMVHPSPVGSQMPYPGVADIGYGQFVVAWKECGYDSLGYDCDVLMEVLSYDPVPGMGVRLEGPTRVNQVRAGEQAYPSVVALGSSKFQVSYASRDTGLSNDKLYAQAFRYRGKGFTDFVSEQMFNTYFPNKNPFYTYQALVEAIESFPEFCGVGYDDDRKREAAAFLAQIHHETGGLSELREQGCPGGTHCRYCDSPSQWQCANGKEYYGRGPIQLSWNYNYGRARDALGIELLQEPDLLLSDPVIAFKTALWFWMTDDPWYKPSPHQAIVGQLPDWANDQTWDATWLPGFGLTIHVINGGLECGPPQAGKPPRRADQAAHRIQLYQEAAALLGVSTGDNLDCGNMLPF